ncbi:hypothetical protein VTN77DRAFT_4306 [Rasamsonia byssochlamydoides]|uniref:uncharacterized protein n=1 Tax=Rasamsonia byssochlamydoides TaxID=89139 RepID=UPI003744675F
MQSSDLMSGTSEIGSLIAHSNDESQFVGSSSGVFFINTVRQAFSKSLGPAGSSSSAPEFPAAEDTIVGTVDSPAEKHHPSKDRNVTSAASGDASTPRGWKYNPAIARVLGKAPDLPQARELMMMYFRVWHPLFPFLHGPSFLREMEAFYTAKDSNSAPSLASEHRSSCWTTIFQCVFNLASFVQPDLHLPPESKIQSPGNVHSLLGMLLYRHDILSLQALLATQLYLVATMSLRSASLVGGCILRSMLHAGLHRCPFRFKELSSHDRHLRKRIFWCAYAIDRYLSQALGLPLGIQDSDLDVCLPGTPERHAPVAHGGKAVSARSTPDGGSVCRSPMNWSENGTTSAANDRPNRDDNGTPQNPWQEQQPNREATLASYVIYGKLTGRALELFHKSIQNRTVRRSSVLYLVSDVHRWWNSLPPNLQGFTGQDASYSNDEESFDLRPFFSVLYEHLILLINRPWLSLDPSSPDFCSGLQTCIGAARGILSALKAQVDKGQALFWPGLLSAAYMAGLVIAFACQLRQYVLFKGCQEIRECLDILRIMSSQWETAKHCHNALSFLLLNIQRQSGHRDSYLPFDFDSETSAISANESAFGRRWKRPKLDPEEVENAMSRRRSAVSLPPGSNEMTPSSVGGSEHSLNDSPAATNDTSHRPLQPVAHPTHPAPREFLMPPGPRVGFPAYDTGGAADGGGASGPDYSYSPLLMMNLSGLDDPQWPGGSASATNFDLNMTDLFQGSTWDVDISGQPQQQPQPQSQAPHF